MKQHASCLFSRPQHNPIPAAHELLRLLIYLICLSLAQPFAAVAQTAAAASLPSAAQEALNK
jgi:hypothetical protein